jgi:hypothetical protein
MGAEFSFCGRSLMLTGHRARFRATAAVAEELALAVRLVPE